MLLFYFKGVLDAGEEVGDGDAQVVDHGADRGDDGLEGLLDFRREHSQGRRAAVNLHDRVDRDRLAVDVGRSRTLARDG